MSKIAIIIVGIVPFVVTYLIFMGSALLGGIVSGADKYLYYPLLAILVLFVFLLLFVLPEQGLIQDPAIQRKFVFSILTLMFIASTTMVWLIPLKTLFGNVNERQAVVSLTEQLIKESRTPTGDELKVIARYDKVSDEVYYNIETMVQNGLIDPNTRLSGVNGEYSLLYAVALPDQSLGYSDIRILELLLRSGADVNADNGQVITGLAYKAKSQDGFERFKLLLDNGADIDNAKTSVGKSARDILIQQRDSTTVPEEIERLDMLLATPVIQPKIVLDYSTIRNI